MKKIILLMSLLTVTMAVEARKYYFRTTEYAISKWDWSKGVWDNTYKGTKWIPSKDQELVILNTDNSSLTINGKTYYVKELLEGPKINERNNFYVRYMATNDCQVTFEEAQNHQSAQVIILNEDATSLKIRKLRPTR